MRGALALVIVVRFWFEPVGFSVASYFGKLHGSSHVLLNGQVMDDDLALLLTPLCLVTFYIVLFSWQWLRCLIRRPVPCPDSGSRLSSSNLRSLGSGLPAYRLPLSGDALLRQVLHCAAQRRVAWLRFPTTRSLWAYTAPVSQRVVLG